MEYITYLLGAGASANSLPLVLDIPHRLIIFSKYLKNHSNGIDVSNFTNDIGELYTALSPYNTIDGYAKSLSQNMVNRAKCQIQLKKLKSILCGLFTFEQLQKKHPILENEFEIDESLKVKTTLDPRYRTFFGNILNPDGKLNDNVKIISWNYDLQLEIGMENNLGAKYEYLNEICTIFPHPTCEVLIPKPLIFYKTPDIVKLNGTAGIFLRDTGFYNIYIDQNEYFDDQIETILNIHKEINRYHNFNPFLNFSWEQNKHTDYAIEYARSIIQQTQTLVVIGYSFPDFNRVIDKKIFQNEKIKNIYLQLPHTDFDDVKYRLNASVRDIEKVQLKSKLNEFFIPKEL